jgi:gamma-glutamyltranspeptidase/glutathione hydrolase
VKSYRRLALIVLLVPVWAAAAETKPATAGIAASHPLATAAGFEILEAGGNAFDAAVAVSAALSVVEPYSSGLGGGGFWLLRGADGLETFVDGREVAPSAATADMYLDAQGQPVRGLSLDGALAAGIPGLPAGLVYMAENYGRLPLAFSLAPAIRHAEEGFPVYKRFLMGLTFKKKAMVDSPAAMRLYFIDGEPPALGSLFRQPELAQVLREMAKLGAAGFYRGPVAERLIKGVAAAGGIWTLQDLANYRVKERPALSGNYHGMRILTAPPPSAGGVALINMLNILAGYDLSQVDTATRKHLIVEVLRRGFRDRAEFLGDPDFVDVPVDQLLHPFYAAGQRMGLRVDRATPSADLPGVQTITGTGTQTTHFSVLDAEGNAVAGTQSLNFYYGSGFVVPGTGVLLNNEMDDFSIKAGAFNGYQLTGGHANAIQPGKRMLSSMTPTMLFSDEGMAVLGTPGGSRIISMVLLGTLAWFDGLDPQTMVTTPRFHHQYLPDTIVFEAGAFSEAEQRRLTELGHTLRPSRRSYGNMQVVSWEYASGLVKAASDPRSKGNARIY